MSDRGSALVLEEVTVRLGGVDVLRGASLEVDRGEAVGLVGPNGAGKTTLLDAASGLVPLAGGRVRLGGVDVSRMPAHRRARLGLGRTFQSGELFADLTAAEHVLLATGRRARPGAGGDRLPSWLEGWDEVDLGRLPADLPPARCRELALARALASATRGRDPVLVLDEPFAGLDDSARHDLARRLGDLRDDGFALLIADHDAATLAAFCDRVMSLERGRTGTAPSGAAGPVPTPLGGPAGEPTEPEPAGEVLVVVRDLVAGGGQPGRGRPVSFVLGAGEVVRLDGAPGSGRTAVLAALGGYAPIAAGEVEVLGRRLPVAPDVLARDGVASVPAGGGVITGLTVEENLRVARRATRGSVEEALERFPMLRDLLRRPAEVLSGGEQHLVALARAVAARPRLLLVDGLTHGLAPEGAAAAWEAARAVAASGGAALVVDARPSHGAGGAGADLPG